MNIKQLEKIIGTLSNTSKMPAYSWGISAHKCNVGSKFVKIKGTVCYKCYALTGFFRMKNTKMSQETRLNAISMPEWVDYMTELLTLKYKKLPKDKHYHRWFCSGDIQSHEHLMKIFEVCENTKFLKHWLPTREYQIINQIKYKDIPKNLVIRASGIKIDGQPPKFWKWTSTVHTKNPIGYVCPAYLQDRQCKACRTCWHRSVKQVSYKEH